MTQEFKEKRKYERFFSEDKAPFDFTYDLVTKMKFLRREEIGKVGISRGHPGFVKNVSIEGLCFVSDQKLEQGETIDMEVYIPKMTEPVRMQGEVRWAKEVSSLLSEGSENYYKENPSAYKLRARFDAGIHLNTVEGKPVLETVYYDKTYHVAWSIVLESIIGKYRIFVQKNKNNIS